MIKIVSFNILTSGYCNSKTYPTYDANAINNNIRWNKIKDQLQTLMINDVIICLQELSEYWLSKLQVFANDNDYVLIARNYDHQYSDYMGVAILYPNKFKLNNCQMIRPSKLISKFITSDIEENVPVDGIWGYLGYTKTIKKEWYSKLITRNNVIIVIELTLPDGKNITVANYHAPCVWKSIESTCVIAACVVKIFNESKADHLFLAGDFNIRPDSIAYQVLTTGKLITNDYELLLLSKDIDNMNLAGMDSAHNSCYGYEPKITIKTHTSMDGGNIFEGCLDYIFYRSIKVKPSIVRVIPEDNDDYLPSIDWPSDHKMLYAEFN